VRMSRRAEDIAAAKQTTAHAIQKVQPQVEYLQVIRNILPPDGFFVDEVSQVGFTSWFAFPVYQPRTFVSSGYQGTLGFGFPTALGVKMAFPDRAVVSITGDGGFMFGVQELATAVQYGINLVTVIFNNESYGNVRRDQQQQFAGRLIGADLVNPDFIKLSESFGVTARRVTSPDELRPALEDALAAAAPRVIEVTIPRGSEVSPWEFLHPKIA
jgi:acetolactate synthase-1/2/3 large subunit